MIGPETRMLLRHYLEQGASKSALARQLGVSRETVHRWIRDGDLDRDLDATPVRYGPPRAVPPPDSTPTNPLSKRDSPRTRNYPPCGCWRRSARRASRAATHS